MQALKFPEISVDVNVINVLLVTRLPGRGDWDINGDGSQLSELLANPV